MTPITLARVRLAAIVLITCVAGAVPQDRPPLNGTWVATDPQEDGPVGLEIEGTRVRVYWRCPQGRCDLGTFTATTPTPSSLTVAFDREGRPLRLQITAMDTDALRLEVSGPGSSVVVHRFDRIGTRGADLPAFPWPPPKWTSRFVLPRGLVVNERPESLGAYYDRLRSALQRARIEEWSVYAVGSDGFAIVSRMESIQSDGTPQPGGRRWSTERTPGARDSFWQYLQSLFRAEAGRYRVIAFVMTPLAVTAAADAPSRQLMDEMLRLGAAELPRSLRNRVVDSVHCEALIYEFLRSTEDDRARLVESSELLPTQHLAAAGLWTREELSR